MLATSPLSANVVPLGVPTCAKLLHPAPWQRSTRYPVTPTLSVDAVQLRLIALLAAAVAASPVGAVGGVVSGAPPRGALNATICMTQAPAPLSGALAL